MPNCSELRYGDGALIIEVMYKVGSSGGGYVGVVFILGGNGQSPNVLCVNWASGRLEEPRSTRPGQE